MAKQAKVAGVRVERTQAWVERIEGWRKSGQTQVEYCANHALSVWLLRKWIVKLGIGRAQRKRPVMLPIPLHAANVPTMPAAAPILVPDNNLLERQMRAVAMRRKAYLFTASARGGAVAATTYSLVATCKLNRIEPFAYLTDVLGRIRSHRVDRLAELLPFNWSPAGA